MVLFVTIVCALPSIGILASASVQTPAQIEDYITYKAQNEGVNVGLALNIARAESGFEPSAKNPEGSASGVFQYLDSTFRKYCIGLYHLTDTMEQKNNAAIQVNCAIEMLKEPKGYMHWWASHSSWGKYLTV